MNIAPRLFQRMAAAGECLLVLMGVAWALFERPAPVFTVAWREGLSAEARHRDEQQLGLENPQSSEGNTWRYEIWSPRTKDIEAIIRHPDVKDTQYIDRATAMIDPDAGRGTRRVWWAGPFRGQRSRLAFRLAFALVGVATLACRWHSFVRERVRRLWRV